MKKGVKQRLTHTYKTEPRNFGVTVLAGTGALFVGILAMGLFPLNFKDVTALAIFVLAALIFLVLLAIAIYGRKKPFQAVVEALFYTLPS